MQITIVPDSTDAIETALQNLLGQTALTIRCVLRGGRLIVMGQHQDELVIDPRSIFWFLETALHSLSLDFVQQVGLYLHIAGEEQPYARRYFPLQRVPLRPVLPVVSVVPQDEAWVLSDEELDDWMQELVYAAATVEASVKTVPSEVLQPITFLDLEPVEVISVPEPWDALDRQMHDRFALVAGVAAVGLLTSGYAFTRPCTLGACPELERVADLGQQSVQLASRSQVPEAMVAARQPLEQAIATLETIPDWSPRSHQAKTLHHRYQVDALVLEELISVQRLVNRTTRNGAFLASMNRWEHLRDTWQVAIDRLSKVPAESRFYAIAQEKRSQYQGKLAEAEQRLEAEQQAQTELEQAKRLIQTGVVAERAARTAADWQRIQSTWQEAIEQLQGIPEGTTVAVEAERLLQVYQSKLGTLGDRASQQQRAATIIARASEQAMAAQTAQQNQNWRGAIDSWKEALATLATLPPDTAYQAQAQAMAIAYQQLLYIAQRQSPTGADLVAMVYRVCAYELQACTPITVDTAIRVQLNATYARSMATPPAGERPQSQQRTFDRVMQALADQADLPVEVLDPSGQRFKQYSPQ